MVGIPNAPKGEPNWPANEDKAPVPGSPAVPNGGGGAAAFWNMAPVRPCGRRLHGSHVEPACTRKRLVHTDDGSEHQSRA
mmetsp:Transcript_62256/g.160682  ORF Transcript_62256/g.160682 Transcript_62256/m.160682 type:complete len:80 (+) Transcript_62256:74-313(+)